MDFIMRTLTIFECGDAALGGSYDHGDQTTGLLMVTGGTELRTGAHSGMARLAAAVAMAGFPVFRFDRRGVGDSDGADPGFADSAPDIAAAASAFRTMRPDIRHLVGFGLCDGATALALHHHGVGFDALALANPWVVETEAGVPPQAAIAHRYRAQLTSAAGWQRILRGEIDFRKALRGVRRLLAPPQTGLAARFADGIFAGDRPVSIIMATGDATAIAFDREWRGPLFARVRQRSTVTRLSIDSSSHSFAAPGDAERLADFCIDALRRCDRG